MSRSPSDTVLGLARVDALGRLRDVNGVLAQWAGSRATVADLFEGVSDATAWLQQGAGRGWQAVNVRATDGLQPMLAQLHESEHGEHWLALRARDSVAERIAIDTLQRSLLEAVAADRPLPELMQELCLAVESLCHGVQCTVLRVDAERRLRPLAGPSLPAAYSDVIDGLPIGEAVGSCGTAAHRAEVVDVSDIASSPLWANYRELARSFGLQACWSSPVFGDGGTVVATFAVYYAAGAQLPAFVSDLVSASVHLVSLALRHDDARQRIERLAHYDSVTGLPNAQLLALHLRAQPAGVGQALLLVGLDRFKGINEALGQELGDQVLRAVGARLQAAAGRDAFVARVGGDEFAVLLPPSAPAVLTVDASRAAKRLQAQLGEPLDLRAQLEIRPAACLGIVLTTAGQELAMLLQQARLALREAKGAGPGQTRFYLSQTQGELEQRLQLETLLERALVAGELQLVFQPRVSLVDRQVVGAEVLLRWHSAALGMVPPDRFIPLAEETGLIRRIDAWVAQQALAALARWERDGLRLPNLSINVAAPSLAQDGCVDDLLALLAAEGLAPQRLTLELTERAVLADAQLERGVLQRLHAAGVRLSIDDFGTGYSSLGYLRKLPVSELKLDRAFIADLSSSERDQAIVRASVGLGAALGCEVVAEGVETAAQLERLMRLGCHSAQGYHIARPLPEAEFLDFLRRPVLSA